MNVTLFGKGVFPAEIKMLSCWTGVGPKASNQRLHSRKEKEVWIQRHRRATGKKAREGEVGIGAMPL